MILGYTTRQLYDLIDEHIIRAARRGGRVLLNADDIHHLATADDLDDPIGAMP
jgi:hypothetical protein